MFLDTLLQNIFCQITDKMYIFRGDLTYSSPKINHWYRSLTRTPGNNEADQMIQANTSPAVAAEAVSLQGIEHKWGLHLKCLQASFVVSLSAFLWMYVTKEYAPGRIALAVAVQSAFLSSVVAMFFRTRASLSTQSLPSQLGTLQCFFFS